MTSEELLEKLNEIQNLKCETEIYEYKKASDGCPKKLYDTLSSFSNQDEGGIIFFGIDEENGYAETGVYDPQDIQKKINEQCHQMEPIVRPLLTVAQKDGKSFVSAEIPGLDISQRPCFYSGKGRLKGSYVRVGDSDEPMTEYEIYNYEAFKKGNQDEIRTVPRATFGMLDAELLDLYIRKLKNDKPNFGSIDINNIYELMNITRNNEITLSTLMLFGLYPQAYFPQLCITAVVVPGTEIGETGELGERFLDNKRIEGNIETMLRDALNFLRKNMRNKTIINPKTGEREDTYDYPLTAIREAILNALVHRDYSVYTERTPIQIIMYEDRLEIISPGQIYGRIRTEQLGKTHPDTRNPALASALEILRITENRYSGIPTMRREMKKQGLREPEFIEQRGTFLVKFYRDKAYDRDSIYHDDAPLSFVCESSEYYAPRRKDPAEDLIAFCKTPRTRQEICEFLGISSISYAIREKVMPLVKEGKLHLTIPDKPKSAHQLYYS